MGGDVLKQTSALAVEDRQGRIQVLAASFLLGCISLLMSVVNFFWSNGFAPAVAAFLFAVVSLINALLMYLMKQVCQRQFIVLVFSSLVYSFYLVISGGVAGLGPVWVLLFPLCGAFLIGAKWGSAASLFLFAGIIFLLNTPWGGTLLLYDYPSMFRLRFPVVYLAFLAIGLLFELLHTAARNQADEQRKAIEQLSHIDLLTGISNRWWYNEQLKNQNSQPEYRRRYAVFLIDIDQFKEINDTYGHLYGDEVLVTVAGVIKQTLQGSGIVCRWGGDEFLSQSRAASNEETLAMAERIRTSVSGTAFTAPDGTPLSVTVSIGAVYVPNPQDVYSTELFSVADQALYAAKNSGRNRVEFRTTRCAAKES